MAAAVIARAPELPTPLAGIGENTDSNTQAAEVAECWAPQLPLVPASRDNRRDEGEAFLTTMHALMDQHLMHLRESQQRLVNVVELACRKALGKRFGQLVLVGSVALCAETPGSDIDVVCFTKGFDKEGGEVEQHDKKEAAALGIPTENLRKVRLRKVLEQLVVLVNAHYVSTSIAGNLSYHMELIEDARVPLLHVEWGSAQSPTIAVDILVDQRRPLDHVRWFQAIHACPLPSAPAPSPTPLVTVVLRSIKWWLRQRQIPRTKEGGLPTIAWLLMALHTTSHTVASNSEDEWSMKSTMEQLLICLTAFFRDYSAPGALHGALRFSREAEDGSYSSEFRRSPRNADSPWSELVVLDPAPAAPGVADSQDVNLAPCLSAATQLLIAYELQRAACLLQGWNKSERSGSFLEALFLGHLPMKNSLPAIIKDGPVTCLLLQGNPSQGVGTLQVVVIEKIFPRPGWNAPFLHRFDTSSELYARVFDVCEESGSCDLKPEPVGHVVLCPCHFVCMIELQRDGSKYKVKEDDLRIYRTMQRTLSEMQKHQRALGDLPSPSQKSAGEKANLLAVENCTASKGVDDANKGMVADESAKVRFVKGEQDLPSTDHKAHNRRKALKNNSRANKKA
mmetsp:Transcript_52871/g.83986  ORF Transcript_52871/g.83986 Transcript_52871/m.83986 type:complete len:623 (-) Transcript_52871:234-2102(-)